MSHATPLRKDIGGIIVAMLMASASAAAEPLHRSAAGTNDGGSPATEHTIVLTNGNVLHGIAVQNGDTWEISSQDATIYVSTKTVSLVANSLTEAYEMRRQQLRCHSAGEHVQFARWCLRHGLYAQAAQELAEARKLDPDYPRLALLERQLAVLTSAGAKPAAPSPARPQYEPPLSPQAAMEAAAESLVDMLPTGSLEQFNRRVQPVLVNNCTAAGCHREGGSTDFQLSRALLFEESHRGTTLRNLAAVFAQIDQQNPRKSPLITVPLSRHGGLDHPVFPPHRRELQERVVDWVLLATSTAASDDEMEPDQLIADSMAAPQSSAAEAPLLPPSTTGGYPGRSTRPARNVRYGARLRRVPPSEPADR